MNALLAALGARAIVAFARVATGVRGNWLGCQPASHRRIYYANHASHGDFVLIWTVIPPRFRSLVRPVAGLDYWRETSLRRFISQHIFKAVLIERKPKPGGNNPIDQMVAALDDDASLILFPEGTRNTTGDALLPFKSGLFRIAQARPDVEIIPTWIDNLNRVLPKGEFLPIPLLCTVTFGEPLMIREGEECDAFLDRARTALLRLSSKESRS